MDHKIAVVVLGCASAPYDEMVDAMRTTWGAVETPGVEVSYVYGNPSDSDALQVLAQLVGDDTAPVVPDGELERRGDILIAGCADLIRDQEDSLLRKRLLAFEHLLDDPTVRQIYTVCAASYVDQPTLVEATAGLRSERLFYGPISFAQQSGTPFISGSSMLLSRDLAERLVDDKVRIIEQNRFGWRDDVTFGHWVATQYCDLPLDELIEVAYDGTAGSPERVFAGGSRQTADFVMVPIEEHTLRDGVYHYHVHSRRPEAIRHLHELWLAQQATGSAAP